MKLFYSTEVDFSTDLTAAPCQGAMSTAYEQSFFHFIPLSSSAQKAAALPGKYDLVSSIENIIFKA